MAVQAFMNPITPKRGYDLLMGTEHSGDGGEGKKDLNVLSLMAVQYEKQI